MAYYDTSILSPTHQAARRRRARDMLETSDILALLSRPKVSSRFWKKIDVRAPNDCWIWTGAKWGTGYGKMYLPGPVPFGAHRASWIIANQQNQPADMFVCHECDVKPCVNPAHLYLGTPLDNSRDAIVRGQFPIGSRQGIAKLVEADIPIIRRLSDEGIPTNAIARRFGVSNGAIWLVVNGRNWRHISLE